MKNSLFLSLITKPYQWLAHGFQALVIFIVRCWQLGPSQILPPTCRYAPSCSAYMIGAIKKYGVIKGGWIGMKRLLRCHPWGGSGYDPVP